MEAPVTEGAVVAKVSTGWVVRMVVAGVAFAGFAVWCLYDGLVKYPAINDRYEQYQQLHEQGRLEEWPEVAREQGWSPKQMRESDVKSDWDIRTQFIMAGVCAPIGLIVLIRLGLTIPRRLAADDTGLITTRGKRIPYDAITAIDKKKWDRKAIAVVHYKSNGKEETAKIDDWIFKGGAQVLQTVEAHLSPDIPGVEPQRPTNEASQEEDEGGAPAKAEDDDIDDGSESARA